MRKQEFRIYLQQQKYTRGGIDKPYTYNAINHRISLCACVERDHTCNLDQEYQKDELQTILNGLPGNIRNAVLHYKRFCALESLADQIAVNDEDLTAAELEEEAEDVFFGYEAHLRDFIASNIQSIPVNGKKLTLQNGGVEFPTDVGPIDILATDQNGDFVVFELKRARTPDHTIGQLSRYMGWVMKTLAKGKTVHGVIVGREISQNLKYAQSVIPNVSLLEYEIDFKFKDAAN